MSRILTDKEKGNVLRSIHGIGLPTREEYGENLYKNTMRSYKGINPNNANVLLRRST